MLDKFRKKMIVNWQRQVMKSARQTLQPDLEKNVETVFESFGFTNDLCIRRFSLGKIEPHPAALLYLNGMTNQEVLDRDVIEPLMRAELNADSELMDRLIDSVLHVSTARLEVSLDGALDELAQGNVVLFIHSQSTCIVIEAKALEQRSVEEPAKEAVIRGPREGFIENLDANLSLVRKRYHNRNLQVETYRIGRQSHTRVSLVYIRDLAKNELIVEARKRLSEIKMDALLDSAYVEQWIEDAPFSIFPTVFNSEKPDAVLAKLLDGRVAVFVDGTPVALVVPATLQDYFQSPDDYYSRPFYASFIRLLRYAAFFVSSFLPSLYISLENFQKELVPTTLLFSFVNAREGVPFPLAFELLMMAIVYEWLREAGVRMPRPIGQAVSIVGALVIGEAAVSAGLIGAPTVIVIAASAITSFIVPPLNDVAVILRFLSILVTAVFGLYGNFLMFYVLGVYLCDLRSFGIPYFTPLAPLTWRDWKDYLVRFPLWLLKYRPDAFETVNERKSAGRKFLLPQRRERGKS